MTNPAKKPRRLRALVGLGEAGGSFFRWCNQRRVHQSPAEVIAAESLIRDLFSLFNSAGFLMLEIDAVADNGIRMRRLPPTLPENPYRAALDEEALSLARR